MIPENVELFTTDGERDVYHFLASVAKPDSEYYVWYAPDILGREPDFIIYNDSIGLVILEVKDWSLNQILQADKKQFRLYLNGKEETRKNPLLQAREYFISCKEAIQKDGLLISGEGTSKGNPKVPLSWGVVFTNINKFEFQEKSLDNVVEVEKTFFWDDLHSESPICTDLSGVTFQNVLQNKFTPLFPFHLSGKEKSHLRNLLFPIIRIGQSRKNSVSEYVNIETRLSSLDHHQEVLARNFDGGHRILRGPSGCGKTITLIHRAVFLKRYNPHVKRILFVCYNITLVNYIKRILTEKRVPLGKNGVDVVHFFELCNRLITDKIDFEGQDEEYYQLVIEEAAQAAKEYEKYDAILIDEGQDFSDGMFRVIMNLLSPKTDCLTIALDDNQNIYSTKSNWKDLGIHARGRTHLISNVYRSTKELTEFSKRYLVGGNIKNEQLESSQVQLFSNFFDYHGPGPEIKKYADVSSMLDFIAKKIDQLVTIEGYPLSEIGVLYTTKDLSENRGELLPDVLREKLSEYGILSNWISEDYRSKKAYDITTDSVVISTIHSVKGFDFAALFVLGLDFLTPERWSEDQITRLAYVAITRARYRLYIPYINESQVIERLMLSK